MPSLILRLCLARVLVVGALAAIAVPGAAAVAVADGGPTITLSSPKAQLGARLEVTGAGWGGGELVGVTVCGDAGRDGSVGCARENAAQVLTLAGGGFRAALRIGRPPVACPCVVAADSVDGGLRATAKIAIAGVRSAPRILGTAQPLDTDPQIAAPVVISARLAGGSWTELFGVAPRRTLSLTVRNPGSLETAVTIDVRDGRGSGGDGFVGSRSLRVPSRGTATLSIPIRLPTLSIGSYRVHGTVAALGGVATFGAGTSSWPLGLVGIVVTLAVVAAIGAVARRSRQPTGRHVAVPGARSAGGASEGHPDDAAGRRVAPEPAPRFEPLFVPPPRAAGEVIGAARDV